MYKGGLKVSNLNNEQKILISLFENWLQCNAGIDTVEKYEALSDKEYLELKKQFLEWFSKTRVSKIS